MSKIYKFKQKNCSGDNPPVDQLTALQTTHQKDRRKNELLNGFIFMIGLVGFLTAFWLPRDLIYNRTSLENSFSNPSNSLASSSLVSTSPVGKQSASFNFEEHFKINGIMEADEMLEFRLETFDENSDVIYTLHFGNGAEKEISDASTYYKYHQSGNYEIKIMATYHGESKELYSEKISIDEAIFVNSEAFVEIN